MNKNIVRFACLGLLVAPGIAAAADEAVADAAKRQDKMALRAFIQQRVDINAPQPDGATALHWAAHWNDLEMTETLLKSGARVNAVNDYAVTPLSLAATNGSLEMVERLLKAGANPNLAMSTGETPLMSAVRAGSVPVVKALLAAGADANAKGGGRDQTALMWAVAQKKHDIAKVLIDHRAAVDSALGAAA